jgi:sensor histidine kinase YesM
VNRRSAQRILEGVRGAELKRVQIERRLTESRLATAQAQIDPHILTRSLTEVRNLYKRGSPEADLELDALIQRLQATVTGSAGSDLRGGATP